ncbi:MAG: ParB N-terminal domain-containing protein [Candidatus Bathyarchaeia archaeon]
MTWNLDPLWKKLTLDIFLFPEKYSVPLPIDQIVADAKVDADGVIRYKEQLASGKQLRPIVVVKHPRKDLYAVVDGHHRFFAQIEFGQKDIDCAVIQDFVGFMFQLTKDGWLQPHPAFTKHVRVPILEFHQKLDQSINQDLRQNLKQFLADFNQNPEKLIEKLREVIENSS